MEPWSFNSLKKSEKAKSPDDFFHRDLLSRTQVDVGGRKPAMGGLIGIKEERLLHHLNHGSFSIFTAHNPNCHKMTPFQNAERNLHLENDFRKIGAVYHRVEGKYGNEEDSFLVHHTANVTPERLERLAAKHGQQTILHVSRGKHQMKYATGEKAGGYHPGLGYTFNPASTDEYTQLPGKPHTKFNANIDWATFIKKSEASGAKTRTFVIHTLEGKPYEIHFHTDHSQLI